MKVINIDRDTLVAGMIFLSVDKMGDKREYTYIGLSDYKPIDNCYHIVRDNNPFEENNPQFEVEDEWFRQRKCIIIDRTA